MPHRDPVARAAYQAAYRAANREKMAVDAKYSAANREKIATRSAAYRAANKDRLAVSAAERYAANRESVAATNAEYRAANPERMAAYSAAWYAANRELVLSRAVEYQAVNREKIAEYQARYRQANAGRLSAYRAANSEKARENRGRRRARKANLLIETPKRSHVWSRTAGVCHLCMRPVSYDSDWHAEHVIPLSAGGVEHIDNLAVAHKTCNLSKHVKWTSSIPWIQKTALDVSVLFHLGPYTKRFR